MNTPSNNPLHPTPGAGLGVEFMRAFARRG